MVKFQVIKGESKNLDEVYALFKEDFLNPNIKVPDLMKKYNLSRKDYVFFRERVFLETGLKIKPVNKTYYSNLFDENRLISQHSDGTCTIIKWINGHCKNFGTYPDLESAKVVRDKLIENDWDEDILNDLKMEYATIRSIPAYYRAIRYYDDFEELYLNDYSRDNIINNLGISYYQYHILLDKVKENNNIPEGLRRTIKKGEF